MASNIDECEFSLVVSNIPVHLDLKDVELHFMNRKNGGSGDVTSVNWEQSTTATKTARLTFEFDSTVASVLAQSHIVGGSQLQLTLSATFLNGTQLTINHLDNLANFVYPDGFVPIWPGAMRDESRVDQSKVPGFYQLQLSRRITKLSTSTQTDPVGMQIDDNCVVCMDALTNANCIQLDKCGHKYHLTCILQTFSRVSFLCPMCKQPYGVAIGVQPANGRMTITKPEGKIPGYNSDIIAIHYEFPGGTQQAEHPHPGQHYVGTSVVTYLPDNPGGQKILKLMRMAFDNLLIFVVNEFGRLIFDDKISHKTQVNGSRHGYPDVEYLGNVKKEFAALGLHENMLNSE